MIKLNILKRFVPRKNFHLSGEIKLIIRLQQHFHNQYRYDPTCIGDSPGSWDTLEFRHWIENAEAVLEAVGAENNILVGSSMGGWISLLLASQSKLKQKIKALVLIAPALNFLRPFYQQIYANSGEHVRRSLDNGEVSCSLKENSVFGKLILMLKIRFNI